MKLNLSKPFVWNENKHVFFVRIGFVIDCWNGKKVYLLILEIYKKKLCSLL